MSASRRIRSGVLAGAALAVPLLVSCGSSGSTTTATHLTTAGSSTAGSTAPAPASSTAPPGSSTPPSAQVEVNPPGDIPDNQAFVPFAGSGFVVRVPEGWSRTTQGTATVFADKYNRITIAATAASSRPSVATVRSTDLPALKASSPGFAGGAVSTVQRKAGAAILATYRAYSPVNPVTGKVADEAVERYTFWRSGHEVVLTLEAPVGSDNVDPWRTVTDSFAWTRP